MKKKFKVTYYIIFLILYLEFMFKTLVLKDISMVDVLYTILLSIPTILAITVLCSIFKEKPSRIILIIISAITILYFIIQVVFFKLFSVPFSFETIGLAGGALGFTDVLLDIIKNYLGYILIFSVPLIMYAFIRKKLDFERFNARKILKTCGILAIIFIIDIAIINIDKEGVYSAYNLYYKIDAPEKNIQKFGMLTATKLDLRRTVGGFEDSYIKPSSEEKEKPKEVEKPIQYGENKMQVNFEELKNKETNQSVIDIYNYMENTKPSKQNKYTGYFKGKNLIFILAESFNSIAVSPELTPTLYKLTHSGFVFKNFYSPVFLSTTGGEFQATTGLIPTQATLRIWKDEEPTIKFGIGNSFSKVGYTPNAYHNWTYNYYQRQKTMKTLGFSSYMGLGNGLEKLMDGKWIPSDVDLINATTDFYINNDKFVTYYVSMSGHAPYFLTSGQPIAYKNRELVKDLPYCSPIKAYIAAQIEFDRAMETLINNLDAAGKLDDTVIAFVGDHYPYTISIDDINQVSDYKRDAIVEVNRSNFVLWNNKMEKPVEVEKVGSQIDVLPTLLNLFGIEYDSRMIIGQDILSDKEGLAIFSNRSWVSDLGTYFYSTGKFETKEGKEIPEGYVKSKNTEVANKFTMSNLFIKHNIYEKIFGE